MQEKYQSSLLPPRPGDITPPNPEYSVPGDDPNAGPVAKNFCVWTSMLNRSIETAKYFDEEEYDIKEMRMLNELSAGVAEGMTYEEIRAKYPEEYAARRRDKLHYRYPGAGGESYLDVINRLRAVIVEVERMTDHVLLVGHRVVARVLLAYFLGLDRDDVACLDVPLGMLYVLEPVSVPPALKSDGKILTLWYYRNHMVSASRHTSTILPQIGLISYPITRSRGKIILTLTSRISEFTWDITYFATLYTLYWFEVLCFTFYLLGLSFVIAIRE